MPCFCEPDDRVLDADRRKIKFHAQEIVEQIKFMVHPTNRYPEELKDAMKLIEHLYTGECDEKKSSK